MRLRIPNITIRSVGPPALVALTALAGILCALDPAGDYPGALSGPGLTIDETFNVQEGVRLVEAVPGWLTGALTLRDVFGDRDDFEGRMPPIGYHLPDHPPLGRLWIGVCHKIALGVAPPGDHPSPFVTACARTGPATAFALLVFLVGSVTARWYGPAAGFIAAISLVLMPRVFGHAHLAALETFVGLTYTATVLSVAAYWCGSMRPSVAPPLMIKGGPGGVESLAASVPPSAPPYKGGEFARGGGPSMKVAALTGLVFGLALLTKIQAVLLPVPIALWALFHHRHRAILPLAVWTAVGLLTFVAFWPWLWLDPVSHFTEYFGRAADRVALHAWYFGQRYADVDVPWHYPWVMFLLTVPVGLHLLGGLGLFAGHDRRGQLVLACAAFPLVVFSLPWVAVYDGARLFLVVFPLWAVMIGRGGAVVLAWLRRRWSQRAAVAALAVFVALQGYGLVAMRPCYLSYYNGLVGGLWGAERLGLETNYWGDSLTRDFLRDVAAAVPEGTTIEVAPVLHGLQLPDLVRQSPILRNRRITLLPFDAADRRYVLFFRRKADLPEMLKNPPETARLLAEVRRQGVQLAALYEVSGEW